VVFTTDFSSWDTDGCETIRGNNSMVMCQCDHMTPFSVLMQVQDFEVCFYILTFCFLSPCNFLFYYKIALLLLIKILFIWHCIYIVYIAAILFIWW